MTAENKSRPLEVKLEVLNKKDWKLTKNLIVKVTGLFRNRGWRVDTHSYLIINDSIEINVKSKHLGGLSAMVLTPFEIIEKVPLEKKHHKIRVIIDGDICTSQDI